MTDAHLSATPFEHLDASRGRDRTRRELLLGLLTTAVPLEIAAMEHCTEKDRLRVGLESVNVIASRGDLLLYRGGKRGETAKVFAALARGLAALAYRPGGVGLHGLHWCVGSGHQGTREETPCWEEVRRESEA